MGNWRRSGRRAARWSGSRRARRTGIPTVGGRVPDEREQRLDPAQLLVGHRAAAPSARQQRRHCLVHAFCFSDTSPTVILRTRQLTCRAGARLRNGGGSVPPGNLSRASGVRTQ
eukprot:7117155-Prymnesium_polylepis.1